MVQSKLFCFSKGHKRKYTHCITKETGIYYFLIMFNQSCLKYFFFIITAKVNQEVTLRDLLCVQTRTKLSLITTITTLVCAKMTSIILKEG